MVHDIAKAGIPSYPIIAVGNTGYSLCYRYPPPRARYIRERVSRQLSLTFSNASQNVLRLLRILIETLPEFVVRNRVRILTSQSELPSYWKICLHVLPAILVG